MTAIKDRWCWDHAISAVQLIVTYAAPVCRNAAKTRSKPATAGGTVGRGSMFDNERLWLDVVEGAMGGLSLVVASLNPLWHSLRGMFGLSLLFYGEEFATLAFHIIVFRLSGWKKVLVMRWGKGTRSKVKEGKTRNNFSWANKVGGIRRNKVRVTRW
ncbi:unnamed protein product [Laminaria digitata]